MVRGRLGLVLLVFFGIPAIVASFGIAWIGSWQGLFSGPAGSDSCGTLGDHVCLPGKELFLLARNKTLLVFEPLSGDYCLCRQVSSPGYGWVVDSYGNVGVYPGSVGWSRYLG